MSALIDRLKGFRQPAIFGLSAALSRAGGILAVPIAAQALSLEDLGYYAICVAFIQLLCQFLSLGGSVAVAKAGAESADDARALALRFSMVAIGLGGLVFLAGALGKPRYGLLVGLVALISALEAQQQLYQLVIRAREREGVFLFTSILKAFAWPLGVLAYILTVHQGRVDLPIEVVLTFQLATYAAVSIGFVIAVGFGWNHSLPASAAFGASILLSVPMVLHSFSQWVMNSADRVILGQLTSGETLAFYSLAYSLASIMFVIVSGMALYLPHEIMKHVDRWGDPGFRYRFLRWYAAAYVSLFILLLFAYMIDYSITNLLRYRNSDMFLVLGIVGTGFLFTGVYHVYVPFLFAAGRTGLVTIQTVKACVAYSISIVPLIYFFDAIGAAIGTMLVWIYYMFSIRKYAIEYLDEIGISDHHMIREITLISASSSVCLLISLIFWAISGIQIYGV